MSDHEAHSDSAGGQLCLDFANTAAGSPSDWLSSYPKLVSWGEQAHVLAADQSDDLRREAQRRPGEASAILQSAIVLRDAVYRIFAAVADGDPPEAADLDVLNDHLLNALSHRRVVFQDDFGWQWQSEPGHLDRMLWPVALSAAELLTTGDLTRVKQCASETCGWLFVDSSRNRSRRWCDMSDCGNRAKARRFYRRQHPPGSTEA